MANNQNPNIQRSDLSQISGINERTIRYLEGLAAAVEDGYTLTGQGNPNGKVKANRSRTYIDTQTGTQWQNTASEYGQNTGWVTI